MSTTDQTEPATSTHDSPANARRSWWERLSWPALIGLGFLVYELTTRPMFGVIVVCLKFGLDDWLTAFWLLRRDQSTARRLSLFWMQMAVGIWKATIAAFIVHGLLVMSVVTVMLVMDVVLNQPGRQVGPRLIGQELLEVALIGIAVLGVIPMAGLLTAVRGGIRVWIDGNLTKARRRDEYPPRSFDGVNRARGLLFPALLMPLPIAAVIAFRLGPLAILMLTGAIGMMIYGTFRRVTADHPGECWPELWPEFFERAYRSNARQQTQAQQLAQSLPMELPLAPAADGSFRPLRPGRTSVFELLPFPDDATSQLPESYPSEYLQSDRDLPPGKHLPLPSAGESVSMSQPRRDLTRDRPPRSPSG